MNDQKEVFSTRMNSRNFALTAKLGCVAEWTQFPAGVARSMCSLPCDIAENEIGPGHASRVLD